MFGIDLDDLPLLIVIGAAIAYVVRAYILVLREFHDDYRR